jgi:hypothetical protein
VLLQRNAMRLIELLAARKSTSKTSPDDQEEVTSSRSRKPRLIA